MWIRLIIIILTRGSRQEYHFEKAIPTYLIGRIMKLVLPALKKLLPTFLLESGFRPVFVVHPVGYILSLEASVVARKLKYMIWWE